MRDRIRREQRRPPALLLRSRPPGAPPRVILMSTESGGWRSDLGRPGARFQLAVTGLAAREPRPGSKAVPASEATLAIASSRGSARRYWRSDANASRQSTAARMRAPIGISVAPQPVADSRCRPTFRGASERSGPPDTGNSTRSRISAPTTGWIFIFSNSDRVSLPGLEMMDSGTASLPMSCRTAAAVRASSSCSREPQILADFDRVELHALQMIVRGVILGVDGQRQRLDGSQVQSVHGLHVRSFLLHLSQMSPVGTMHQVDQGQANDWKFPLNAVRQACRSPTPWMRPPRNRPASSDNCSTPRRFAFLR